MLQGEWGSYGQVVQASQGGKAIIQWRKEVLQFYWLRKYFLFLSVIK